MEFLGCRVKPRRPQKPLGFHTTTREPKQTCTFERSRPSKTPPKFQEKTPRERKRTKRRVGEGKKKERNFGRSGGGGRRRTCRCITINTVTTLSMYCVCRNSAFLVTWLTDGRTCRCITIGIAATLLMCCVCRISTCLVAWLRRASTVVVSV